MWAITTEHFSNSSYLNYPFFSFSRKTFVAFREDTTSVMRILALAERIFNW